jgi:hypothetical protein
MSSQQAKVIAALNLALHPNTVDADIVAGVRGAYRLLGGKTIAGFLGLSASQEELLAELRGAEAKVEGAVEYCNELKIEIQRLQEELAAKIKPATTRRLSGANIGLGLFVAVICVGLFAVSLFLNPRPAVSRSAVEVAQTQADANPSTGTLQATPAATTLYTFDAAVKRGRISLEWYCTHAILSPEDWQQCRQVGIEPSPKQREPLAVTYTSRPDWINEKGQPCREYYISRHGSVEYGSACQGSDGLWRFL